MINAQSSVRWRNWYSSIDNFSPQSFLRKHCSDHAYATEAEALAQNDMAVEAIAKARGLGLFIKYLGAYPEGQTPP